MIPLLRRLVGLLAWFGLLVVAHSTTAPQLAHAQACCSGTTNLTPGRLERHEWLLLGALTTSKYSLGSFDDASTYSPAADGSTQWDFEQQWLSAFRWAERGQSSVLLKTAQSYRDAAAADPEFGGGLGDLQLAARWDLSFTGERAYVPGVALLAALTLPTGTSPEESTDVLGSDATGEGTTRVLAGVALEHAQNTWLLGLYADLTHHFPRRLATVRVERALGWRVAANATYGWTPRLHTGLIATASGEGRSTLNGDVAEGSARRDIELGLALSYEPNANWRLYATASSTPPVDALSRNGFADIGFGFGAVYGFW